MGGSELGIIDVDLDNHPGMAPVVQLHYTSPSAAVMPIPPQLKLRIFPFPLQKQMYGISVPSNWMTYCTITCSLRIKLMPGTLE